MGETRRNNRIKKVNEVSIDSASTIFEIPQTPDFSGQEALSPEKQISMNGLFYTDHARNQTREIKRCDA